MDGSLHKVILGACAKLFPHCYCGLTHPEPSVPRHMCALPCVVRASTHRARVRATFSRRGSLRNPMPWCSLARTHDSTMKSFSRPWNASTLATSISCKQQTHHCRALCLYFQCDSYIYKLAYLANKRHDLLFKNNFYGKNHLLINDL